MYEFGLLNLKNPEFIGNNEAQEAVNVDVSEGYIKFVQPQTNPLHLKEAYINNERYYIEGGVLYRGSGENVGVDKPPNTFTLTETGIPPTPDSNWDYRDEYEEIATGSCEFFMGHKYWEIGLTYLYQNKIESDIVWKYKGEAATFEKGDKLMLWFDTFNVAPEVSANPSDYKMRIYARVHGVETWTLFRTVDDVLTFVDPANSPQIVCSNSNGEIWTKKTFLSGTVEYVITYVTPLVESKPSDPVSINVNGGYVQIDNIPQPTDPRVTSIRIYRREEGATTFMLVAELSLVQTSFLDTVPTEDLGIALDSINNDPPPTGINYIIALHNKLFLAVGNKLYFSKTAQIEAFPSEYYIGFDGEIVGFGIVNENLVIITDKRIYTLYGTDETNFVVRVSDAVVGGKHNSVQDIGSAVLFVSEDGIYATTGISAQKISEKINPLFPITPSEVGFDKQRYYVVSGLDINENTITIAFDTIEKGFFLVET